jgi:chromosome segregation ATPase
LRSELNDSSNQQKQLHDHVKELQESLTIVTKDKVNNDAIVIRLQAELQTHQQAIVSKGNDYQQCRSTVRRTLVDICNNQMLPLISHIWHQCRDAIHKQNERVTALMNATKLLGDRITRIKHSNISLMNENKQLQEHINNVKEGHQHQQHEWHSKLTDIRRSQSMNESLISTLRGEVSGYQRIVADEQKLTSGLRVRLTDVEDAARSQLIVSDKRITLLTQQLKAANDAKNGAIAQLSRYVP